MNSRLCVFAFLASLAMNLGMAHAAPVDIAKMTCAKYQNELLAPPRTPAPPASGGAATPAVDAINTVMWLFGYSVARSGAHVMYGDALAGFGFALDAECKNKPSENLQEALASVKPSDKNPMDLAALDCQTFSNRHKELARTDRESADTIMMWLFGFSTAKAGGHLLDAERLPAFEATLLQECARNHERSVFDTLSTLKF